MRLFLPLSVSLLVSLPAIAQRDCGFTGYKQELLRNDPSLITRMQDIESFTRHFGQHKDLAVSGGGIVNSESLTLITIPVVVHIIYNNAVQDISDAQVQSQLAVLNKDYRRLNPDTAGIPGYYRDLAADCGFQFVLANVDTNGAPTTGIVRRHTGIQGFAINDNMKYSAHGGDDAWDRDRYLNIWVVNLAGGGIFGYSSVVGGPKESDGVVVHYAAFGTMGTAAAPYNLGRTATHEIGHWLNMVHIWGDANCGTDGVDDTPQQQGATYGNPSGSIVTCGNGPDGNMYMNYMDFTDDIGMHMFTYGQRDRMRSLFAPGGFRYPILSSTGYSGDPSSATTPSVASSAPGSDVTMELYPNPAVSTVTVTLTDGSRLGSMLDIFTQTGQQVMSARVCQLSTSLNVSSLPGGVYFIRINDGRQRSMMKLVKL
jgi:hypothetical protein